MEIRVGVGEWTVSVLKIDVLTQSRRDAKYAERFLGFVGWSVCGFVG